MNNPENVLNGSYSKCLKGSLLSYILANNYFRKCLTAGYPGSNLSKLCIPS